MNFLKENWQSVLVTSIVSIYSLIRILIDKTLFIETDSTVDIIAKTVPIVIVIAVVTYLLARISFEDLKDMEVSAYATYLLLGILAVVNIVPIAFGGIDYQVEIWNYNEFIPRVNLLSGLVLGLFTTGMYFLTNKKGLGEGDIFFMTIVGFTIGFHNFMFAFYVIIFSALLYGILNGLHVGQIRGKKIPMIPFISLGIVLSFMFGSDVTNFISNFF